MNMTGVEGIVLLGAIGLIMIGLAGLFMSNNVFRMVLALVILESGANLFLILAGFHGLGIAPIFLSNHAISDAGHMMNDPIPQALVLTAIVIGVGVQALALALILKIKAHYNTLDMSEIRQQMEYDLAKNNDVTLPASAQSPDSLVRSKVICQAEQTQPDHIQAKADVQQIGGSVNG